jgi:hypothetical protein
MRSGTDSLRPHDPWGVWFGRLARPWLACIVALVGIHGLGSLLGNQPDAPSGGLKSRILADWRERQNACRTVRYKVSALVTLPGRPMEQPEPGEPPTSTGPEVDTQYEAQIDYLLDFENGRMRIDLTGMRWNENDHTLKPVHEIRVFDGSQVQIQTHRPYLAPPKDRHMYAPPAGQDATAMLALRDDPLFFSHGMVSFGMPEIPKVGMNHVPELIQLRGGEEGQVNGLPIRLLRLPPAGGYTNDCNVDLELKSAITSTHIAYEGRSAAEHHIRYDQSRQVPLLQSWSYTTWLGEHVDQTWQLTVRSLDLDVPVQSSDFTIEPRTGQSVYIPGEGRFRANEDGQLVPDPGSQQMHGREGGFWTYLSLSALVSVAILAIWLVRKSRGSRV